MNSYIKYIQGNDLRRGRGFSAGPGSQVPEKPEAGSTMANKFELFQKYLELKQQYQDEYTKLQAISPEDIEYTRQQRTVEGIRRRMQEILKKLEKLR